MILVSVTQGREKKVIHAREGRTLMDILRDAGILIDLPCGGRGFCGKCTVKAGGALSLPNKVEKEHLAPDQLANGWRLSCLARAQGDCWVTIPPARSVQVETGGDLSACAFAPAVTSFAAGGEFEIDFRGVAIERRSTHTPVLGAAFDIGTTTLAARFFDLETGCNLGTEAMHNPQRHYGADVMARIAACAKGTDTLCQETRKAMALMTERLCTRIGAKPQNIYHCVIAGNTVMQHITAGLSPAGMAAMPFEPASLFGCEQDVNLCINPHARVYLSPCVSAFVGGDMTAGLLSCGFDRADKPVLLADIGTNGEMALFCGGEILCCSTAAGPAFEGAHIACGTGSVNGAINRVFAADGTVGFETIGNGKPIGICGSGLVDATAVLLELGLLDETGALFNDGSGGDGRFCFGDSGVYLTQRDLREVQLAKSAIASGIDTLLETAGLRAGDLSQVYVAGGFGTRMDTHSACRIGLLPPQVNGLAKPVGNSALTGACMLLFDDRNTERIQKITQKCRVVELAGNAYFQNRFVENMLF